MAEFLRNLEVGDEVYTVFTDVLSLHTGKVYSKAKHEDAENFYSLVVEYENTDIPLSIFTAWGNTTANFGGRINHFVSKLKAVEYMETMKNHLIEDSFTKISEIYNQCSNVLDEQRMLKLNNEIKNLIND